MSVPNPASTYWVPLASPPGGGASLTYEGDYVPATTYDDGDVVVANGVAFICVGGPTTVAPDIAPWGGAVANRPPGELAYAEVAADTTVSATTAAGAVTVVTAPAITVDGVTPIVVEFQAPRIDTGTDTGNVIVVNLWDGSTDLGYFGSVMVSGGTSVAVPFNRARRLTPAAGSHTYSVRVWRTCNSGFVRSQAPNLPAFIRVSQANPVLIAPAGPTVATYGIALPSSPADGQEHVLVDSLTNPSYQWRFRYNAGSTSTYKWEFIGGNDVRIFLATQEAAGVASTWVDLATPGPLFAVPRAGDYNALGMVQAGGNAAGIISQAAIAIGATTPGWATAATIAASAYYSMIPTQLKINAPAAGNDIRIRYYSTATAGSFANRSLSVHPVRVA